MSIKPSCAALKYLLRDFVHYKASFLSTMYRGNFLHLGFLLFVFVVLVGCFGLYGVLGR